MLPKPRNFEKAGSKAGRYVFTFSDIMSNDFYKGITFSLRLTFQRNFQFYIFGIHFRNVSVVSLVKFIFLIYRSGIVNPFYSETLNVMRPNIWTSVLFMVELSFKHILTGTRNWQSLQFDEVVKSHGRRRRRMELHITGRAYFSPDLRVWRQGVGTEHTSSNFAASHYES